MNNDEIVKRFGYHPPQANVTVLAHETIRSAAAYFAGIVAEVVPPGREQALAFTAIEEAMMWGNAGIARNQ